MRQTSQLCTAVTAIILFCAHSANAIDWKSDLDEARALAQQQGKLLLIHFWTPDCGPCKVVDKKVFPTPQVSDVILQNYVPLKVNAYQNTTLRDYFNVRRWPTDVIATVEGKSLHQMVTPQNPAQYAHTLLTLAQQNRSEGQSMLAKAAAKPKASTNAAYNRSAFQTAKTPSTNWANQIAAPDLTENTARARRPGVGMEARDSFGAPIGGPMGSAAISQGAVASRQATRAAANPGPVTIENRFTTNQQLAGQVPPATRQTEIVNRFAQPSQQNHNSSQAPQSMLAQNSLPPQVPSQQLYNGTIPQQSMGNATQLNDFRGASQQPSSVPAMPGQPSPSLVQANTPQGNAIGNQPASSASDPNVALPSVAPEFGLDGRCPVTLITQRKWVKGSQQWGAVHRGKTYLFAGPEEQQRFLASPDDFSPVLAGMDIVALATSGRVVNGERKFGVLYDDDGDGPRPNRIYLFDSPASRGQFEQRPEAYVQPVMQAFQQNQLQNMVR